MTSLRQCMFVLLVGLLIAGGAYAQAPPELNLTLGEQRVRFAPTRGFQEMRLEIINRVGEIVFTHTTTEAEFVWDLRAGSGETLMPGLYAYALTLKFGEEQISKHAGHFIIEKNSDQVWLTAQQGAEVSGTALNVARASGRSIAGLRTAEDKSAQREVEGREVIDAKGDEKGNDLTDANKDASEVDFLELQHEPHHNSQ